MLWYNFTFHTSVLGQYYEIILQSARQVYAYIVIEFYIPYMSVFAYTVIEFHIPYMSVFAYTVIDFHIPYISVLCLYW